MFLTTDQELALGTIAVIVIVGMLPLYWTNPPEFSTRRKQLAALMEDWQASASYFTLIRARVRGQPSLVFKTANWIIVLGLFPLLAGMLLTSFSHYSLSPALVSISPAAMCSGATVGVWFGRSDVNSRVRNAETIDDQESTIARQWLRGTEPWPFGTLNAGILWANYLLIAHVASPWAYLIPLAVAAPAVGSAVIARVLMRSNIETGLFRKYLRSRNERGPRLEVQAGYARVAGTLESFGRALEVRRDDGSLERIPWGRIDWIVYTGLRPSQTDLEMYA